MSVSESAAELLGDQLVFEYLKGRGLARTAEVYALETRRKYPALSEADELSAQLWVNFRQKLGINKFLRDEADAAAAATKRASRGNAEVAPPAAGLTGSTLEFILKRTLQKLNSGGAGFDGAATGDHAVADITPVSGGAANAGDSRDEAAAHQSGSGGSGGASSGGGGGGGGGRKKKKKPKSRKYQPPPVERNPDVNHNLQFHSLGKPVTTRRHHSRMDSDEGAPSLSRESWMPMELRLKMLKRDMQLAKHKMKDVNDWEYRKQKQAPKTDAHTRRKTLQKLTQRSTLSRNMCALCEHDFPELPFGVTYKAIMDLRRVWGVKVVPESRYLKFTLIPHCYETVRVCVFCSQFFGIDFFDGDRQKAIGV